jgi:hypothetical protein
MNRPLRTEFTRGTRFSFRTSASFPWVIPWPTVLVLAFLLSQSGGVAQAQLGKVLREAAAREAAEVAGASFDIDESMFNQWVYGSGPKVASIPEHLESTLMLAIEDIDRSCSLSEAQRRKLVLAGHGDRKRFLDRVDDARRVFERLRHDPDGPTEIVKYTGPLAADYDFGLYGEGSFFAKTLATTLTPDQASRYRNAQQEKLKFRYRAKVTLILSSLDTYVGFTSDQSRKLGALILEETTPPRRVGGPYESEVVLVKIANLPEAKFRQIVDEPQWKTLGPIFEKFRGMEPTLRANGHLD